MNQPYTYTCPIHGRVEIPQPDLRSKEHRQLNEAELKIQAMAVLMERSNGQIIASDVETLIGIHLLERDDQMPKTRKS